MKLQRLVIRDIRTFEGEHSLSLHDSLTVIVGKNNAGKSTLLEAMYVIGASEAVARLASLERVRGGGGYAALSGEVTPGELIAHARDLPGHFLGLTQVTIEGFPLVKVTYDLSGEALIAAGNGEIAISGQGVTRAAKNGDWSAIRPSPGDPSQWLALYRLIRGDAMLRVAGWSHFGVVRHEYDPKKRLLGSEEEDLRRALVFLRLCHPHQFDLLEEELTTTFPEFEQISFVDDRQNDTWEPRFKIRGREQTNVARKQFGAGTWAFFCILTAAHVAKVTGAEFLLLDEPTLYMHPSLERRLLAVLTNPAHWEGSPLRLVAITHSRLWADEAMRRGAVQVVDWEDQSEVRATIRSPERDNIQSKRSEIVHGLPFLFVEGSSDKEALDLLARDLPLACTVVPLQLTDLFMKADRLKGGVLAVLGRTAGEGFGQPTRVLVDRDKQKAVAAAKELTPGAECPEIFFAGTASGLDFESCFCTREFLAAFVRSRPMSPADGWEDLLQQQLEGVASGTSKGDDVVEWVFSALLGETLHKDTFLSELTLYAQKIRGEPAAEQVWNNLAEVLRALDATSG